MTPRRDGFPAHAGMDPPLLPGRHSGRRLPRTRGDGPEPPDPLPGGDWASPHTRGWTPGQDLAPALRDGFPAHAGMDLGPTWAGPRPPRLPRTRGDGPCPTWAGPRPYLASPHTRGWTPFLTSRPSIHRGFPAHAGMDQTRPHGSAAGWRLPRTRGDGPHWRAPRPTPGLASPHTRGWTLIRRRRHPARRGFPAHAGMDRAPCIRRNRLPGLPRTRGDGPTYQGGHAGMTPASPHTRGWTRCSDLTRSAWGGFPAHAGMDPWRGGGVATQRRLPRTRGDGPRRYRIRVARLMASPHTRGWTPVAGEGGGAARGFPAHAGMDPRGFPVRRPCRRLPRTRGDGPRLGAFDPTPPAASPHTRGWTVFQARLQAWPNGFPAHAGMDPSSRRPRQGRRGLPRTRGDGPVPSKSAECELMASPHTRGWTRLDAELGRQRDGFPAHAGMDPSRCARRPAAARLPRTRGDGPQEGRFKRGLLAASPHTRGWTPWTAAGRAVAVGFPAHAGMDPARAAPATCAVRLPRTRGDGPPAPRAQARQRLASPHTRGWTPGRPVRRLGRGGFPAHAGMDPNNGPDGESDRGLPRTRGDGPSARPPRGSAPRASPHTRGWTRQGRAAQRRRVGFPAHAGMDRRSPAAQPGSQRLPRTRGDGPGTTRWPPPPPLASPHTRGWTLDLRPRPGRGPGFPAHAGMDPH